jgi:hypothetical protein
MDRQSEQALLHFITRETQMLHSWFALVCTVARLGFEAQNVVALQLMRLAAGGTSGQTEARRMIGEKFAALQTRK